MLIYRPITQRALAWTFIAIAAFIVSFLFWGEYARKETVHGILVPDRGVASVYARTAGTVVKISVAENQIVAEGEPLFTVLVEQSTQSGNFADTATLEVIARREVEIAAQIKAAQENAQFDRQNLTAQIAGMSEEIEQLERQRTTQVRLTELSEQDLKAGDQLRRSGTLPETEYRKREQAYLSSDQREADLARQIASRRYDLAQARTKLEQLPITTEDHLAQLRASMLDLDQQASSIERNRAYVVSAPIAGRVTAFQVTLGANPDPHMPLMAIVPADGMLQAEIYIPSRAIGFVKPGQEVRLLYDAFPYQRFGAYRGRVVTVSQAILAGSDVPAVIGAKEPVYRAVVALEEQTIEAEGQIIALQAGGQLTANIILDRRRLIDWILSPLAEVKLLS